MPSPAPFRDQRGITLTELAVALAIFGMIMLGVVGTWSKTQEAYFVGSEASEVQQNVRAAIDFIVRELRSTGRDVTVCAFDFQGAATLDCTSAKVTNCDSKTVASYDGSNGLGGSGCQNVFAIPFANATASTIRIRSDRNDNGTIAGLANSTGDAAEEDVTYALAAAGSCPSGIPVACITRDDGSGPVAMVAVDITGFVLTYYPRSGFGPCAAAGSPAVIPDPCPAFSLPFTSQPNADNIAQIRLDVTALQTTAGQTLTRKLVTDVVLKNRR